MPAGIMLLIPHQVARRRGPRPGHGQQLLREGAEAERLADVILWLGVEGDGVGVGAEAAAVGVDGGGEGGGQPVERDGVEDVGDGRRRVGPGPELLADPGEQRERRRGEDQPDRRRPRRVLERVRDAPRAEGGSAREPGLVLRGGGGGVGDRVGLRDRAEVDCGGVLVVGGGGWGRGGGGLTVHGFAGVVVGSQAPADVAADVAALRDVAREAEAVGQQLVHQARRVVAQPVLVGGRAGGEGEAWEGRHNDMVRQLLGGGVFLLEQREHGQEFEEAARPAVEEGDGDGGGVGREEGGEVDGVGAAVVVGHGEGVVGEGVDVGLGSAPERGSALLGVLFEKQGKCMGS